MTENTNLKRRIRERAARTGESYTAARRHVVRTPGSVETRLTIAVAQTRLCDDPRSGAQVSACGERIRKLVHAAADEGAALVQFPEGALTSPGKYVVSSRGPDIVADADWSAADRSTLRRELDAIAETARRRSIWVVVGGIDFVNEHPRPTNALYVISDRGARTARYDERMLSNTKSTFMYRAGVRPLVFEAHGMRFGCALGMESHYPELFTDYERAGVHCVLLSTSGHPDVPEIFAIEAAGHAATNSYWVTYSGPAGAGEPASGVISPHGAWIARGTGAEETLAVAEIDTASGTLARTWRRSAREAAGLRS